MISDLTFSYQGLPHGLGKKSDAYSVPLNSKNMIAKSLFAASLAVLAGLFGAGCG